MRANLADFYLNNDICGNHEKISRIVKLKIFRTFDNYAPPSSLVPKGGTHKTSAVRFDVAVLVASVSLG